MKGQRESDEDGGEEEGAASDARQTSRRATVINAESAMLEMIYDEMLRKSSKFMVHYIFSKDYRVHYTG